MSSFENLPPFEYTALDPTKQEIRLLKIVAISGDQVECSLEHVSNEESSRPPYRALSYRWGDQNRRKRISVNGKKLEVGPNLFEALKAVHDYFSTELGFKRPLWIDAICLDQGNDAEKAIQIRRMDAIYQNAESVIAWLGPEADGSERVMSILSCMEQYLFYKVVTSKKRLNFCKKILPDETQKRKLRINALLSELNKEFGFRKVNLKALLELLKTLRKIHASHEPEFEAIAGIRNKLSLKNHLFPQEHPFWPAFMNLITRPWFLRVWTFQEIMLAGHRAVVLCGTKNVIWGVLKYSRQNILHGSCWGTIYPPEVLKAIKVDMDTLWRDMSFSNYSLDLFKENTLAKLLLMAGSRYASDRRDYVCGLLGMIHEQQRESIDQRNSPAEVFMSAVVVACSLEHGFGIWCRLIERFSLTDQTTQGLPTWCPDFAAKVGATSSFKDMPKLMFDQEVLKRGDTHGYVHFDQATKTMALNGVPLDKIKSVAKTAPSLSSSNFLKLAKYSHKDRDLLSNPELFGFSFGSGQLKWLDDMEALFTSDGPRKTVQQVYWLRFFFFEQSEWSEEDLLEHFETVVRVCRTIVTAGVKTIDEATRELQIKKVEVRRVHKQIRDALFTQTGWFFFLTTSDRLGFSFRPTEPGDHVCLIPCAQLLYVLSPSYDKFVSCASVVGLMRKPAMMAFKDWTTRSQTFTLK
ncbi:MAG: hypothetical protein Q9227_009056 [Pyrenula ochraceoflavens]